MLRAGRTAGVFQFESPLATETLRAMQCDRFDDLVASNALLRPGPLDAGMHTVFISAQAGPGAGHATRIPELEEMLEPTYGVITYQEQVMRIAQRARRLLARRSRRAAEGGGQEGRGADQEGARQVRRAGGRARPRPKSSSTSWPAQIETFGRYGFNKSHSVAYSVLSYQTAWLKTHYPAEFMAALLSSEIGNTDKVVQYINEARELGLRDPAARRERVGLQVHRRRRQAHPLRPRRGAQRRRGRHRVDHRGRAARAVTRRWPTWCERIDLRLCNKRVFESLIAAGACDSLGGHRTQLLEALDDALQEAQLRAGRARRGPGVAVRRAAGELRAPRRRTLPDVPPWTESERLAREKEVIGFFISGHPLERYRRRGASCSARAPPPRCTSGASTR